MAMDFPSSPTDGQASNGYTWNAAKGAWVGGPGTRYTQAEADAKFVDVTGDTMTGHLFLPTGPAAANAIRKDYVDAADTLKADKSYVDTQDALKADKSYVDSQNTTQNTTISGKADKSYVDSQDAAKVNNVGIVSLHYNGGAQGMYFMDNVNGTWRVVWTEHNFNPASYAALGGATFSGTVAMNGRMYMAGAPTTASAANAHLSNPDGNGLYRNNSSVRYKTDIETITPEYGDKILALRPVFYRSTEETIDDPTWSWFGFISEEVDQVDFRFCGYTTPDAAEPLAEGETWTDKPLIPDHIHTTGILAALVELVQRQEARIAALEAGP